MGVTLSVVLSNCFMNKIQRVVVISLKAKFYKGFVDDIYRRRKTNKLDELFNKINSYHPAKFYKRFVDDIYRQKRNK